MRDLISLHENWRLREWRLYGEVDGAFHAFFCIHFNASTALKFLFCTAF